MNPADVNRRIAEEVMGWKRWWHSLSDVVYLLPPDWKPEVGCQRHTHLVPYKGSRPGIISPRHCVQPPNYFHDVNACMKALEKMREKGWNVVWMVGNSEQDHRVEVWQNERWYIATGRTFMAAACDAILKAIEKD